MHAATNASSNLVLFLKTNTQFFGAWIDHQARTTLRAEIATAIYQSHSREYRRQPYRTPSVCGRPRDLPNRGRLHHATTARHTPWQMGLLQPRQLKHAQKGRSRLNVFLHCRSYPRHSFRHQGVRGLSYAC